MDLFGDKEHWPSLDMQPKDYGLGKSPSAPEPKGSPKWDHRDFPVNNFFYNYSLVLVRLRNRVSPYILGKLSVSPGFI